MPRVAWHRRIAMSVMATAMLSTAFAVACGPPLRPAVVVPSPTPAPTPVPAAGSTTGVELHGRLGSDRIVRVALSGNEPVARVSATARWRIDEQGGRQLLVRGVGREDWRVEQRTGLLRVVGTGTDATPWREGPFVLKPTSGDGMVQYQGRRYRGELWITATDTGLLVVNRLPVEDYLRGVVPVELGTRLESDRAAIEAQVIAARSYTYMRVPRDESTASARGFQLQSTVVNQVYGGADVEHPVYNDAIDATAGLVLQYAGLLVDAPYSSSCGGRSSLPRDNWRDAREEPYLHVADDVNPSTGVPYCDLSPRNHWTAELDAAQLSEVVRRALLAAGASNPSPSAVKSVRIGERTSSGRVGTLTLSTDRGDVTVRPSDLRSVFRDVRGAILPSTYFSVERELQSRGHLSKVALRGAGNGHGVGMCQWGAIGRSRAGQDARTILRHYYPGTVVGFAD